MPFWNAHEHFFSFFQLQMWNHRQLLYGIQSFNMLSPFHEDIWYRMVLSLHNDCKGKSISQISRRGNKQDLYDSIYLLQMIQMVYFLMLLLRFLCIFYIFNEHSMLDLTCKELNHHFNFRSAPYLNLLHFHRTFPYRNKLQIDFLKTQRYLDSLPKHCDNILKPHQSSLMHDSTIPIHLRFPEVCLKIKLFKNLELITQSYSILVLMYQCGSMLQCMSFLFKLL